MLYSFSTTTTDMSSSCLVTSPTRIHPRRKPPHQLRSRVALALVVARIDTKRTGGVHPPRRRQLLFAPRAEAPSTSSSSFEGKGGDYGEVPRHNVAIGGHNPTGGDDSMDEARVLDPYGLVGGRGTHSGEGTRERGSWSSPKLKAILLTL